MPRAVYRLDLETLEYGPYLRHEVLFDPMAFEVEQVWFESLDGTRIPMFLLHKRGMMTQVATTLRWSMDTEALA